MDNLCGRHYWSSQLSVSGTTSILAISTETVNPLSGLLDGRVSTILVIEVAKEMSQSSPVIIPAILLKETENIASIFLISSSPCL